MTQSTASNVTVAEGQPEVRPQRPRPAPPKPGFVEPPTAWDRNHRRVILLSLLLILAIHVFACALFSRLVTGGYMQIDWPGQMRLVPLGQLMVDPHVSIYRVPAQAAVLALLLAGFVAVPIIVGQFYGRVWGLLFLLPLLLVAGLPLLTAGMLPAVWLARSRMLGMVNRFLRGLVAMVFPVGVLWFSTSRSDFIAQGPTELFYLHVPWLAAIAIAVLALLVFWISTRALKYRVGVGLAVTAALLGLTAATFYVGVGEDELEFRMIQASSDPTSPDSVNEDASFRPQEVQEYQRATAARCGAFLARFPNSRYVPYVLYRQARTQDLRCAEIGGTWEFYSNMPSPDGAETWQKLKTRFPDHPLAIVARVRLAQRHLAAGQLQLGRDLLNEAHRMRLQLRQQSRQPRQPGIFGLQPREPDVQAAVDQDTSYLLDWLMLVDGNAGRSAECDQAVAGFFALDPRLPGYSVRLEDLKRSCPSSAVCHSLRLEQVLHEPDVGRRVERLREFIADAAVPADARDHAIDKLASLLVKQDSSAAKDEAETLWRQLLSRSDGLIRERATEALTAMGRPVVSTSPD